MQKPLCWLLVIAALVACSDEPVDVDDDDDGSGASGATATTGPGAGAGPAGPGSGAGTSGDCGHVGEAEPANVAGITAAHNAARCGVDTPNPLPPLAWSSTVAQTAQAYADVLASQGCNLNHSSGPYGENLAAGSGNLSAQTVVDLWMSEAPCYPPGGSLNECSCTCGHYTQIVWRDSTELGCGVANCQSGQVWVCNYNPPGNFIGQPAY